MRRPASRLGATVSLSVVLSLSAAGAGAASEADSPRPVRGASAVRLLGDQVDEAAALNDLSEAELVELLTTDRSAWVDTTGAVFFTDTTAVAPAHDPVSAQAPLDQTFRLHSSPGSTKTIFLDFDGGTASGTGWHASYPATPTTQPAWDLDGNPAVFGDAERTAIQTIWQSVAEDYAPFDVDVTTADPGPDGTNRASSADTAYGSHVLITPSSAAHEAICNPLNNGGGCGGVAYISVFDRVAGAGGDGYGFRQPAWVFPQKLGNSPKNIAEAVSHEVGHNFGLQHDGTTAGVGYYSGHGVWAPIMGVGYSRAVSQWSTGDYAGANNQQDDVTVIRGVAGQRPDEAPTSIVGAPTVPIGTAYVTSRTDVDTYLLGTCSGAVTLTASPLPSFADLDVALSLLDATGQVVATHGPASEMGASLTRSLTSSTYYVSVDGVGDGPWSTGYDDYGSLGAYTLAATGCDVTAPVGARATTTTLTATATGRTAVLDASVTAASAIPAGVVQFRDGTTVIGTVPVSGGAASLLADDLLRGTHHFTAEFVPTDPAQFVVSLSGERAIDVAATATTTVLTSSTVGRVVTLRAAVSPASAGVVRFSEGGTVLGTVTVAAGAASSTVTDASTGSHLYTASFVPADETRYASSASSALVDVTVTGPVVAPPPVPIATPTPTPTPIPATPTAPAMSASSTRVTAPRKAPAGTRPVIRVTVLRGSAAATGTVVIIVGRKAKTLHLEAGIARLRLPRAKAGRMKIVVRYLGDATTTASTAKRTIKVVA